MPAASEEMPQVLELRPIPGVSPSLAEVLGNCPLQAGLSRIPEVREFVLSNPKAWLGTAYHEVLERLWTGPGSELVGDELIEDLWSRAVESLRQRATTHPLDRRFASPVKWPGYHLAHACVQIRARQALAESARPVHSITVSNPSARIAREQQLTAMNGKLFGKPDVVSSDEVRDYKSGSIYEQLDDGKQIVKRSYVRQLRIYGHLVHENTGRCPTKGKLLPMQGDTVEVELEPEACAQAAADAVQLLDTFNATLATASNASDLATPSPAACRWCQFKSLCPAFWQQARSSWTEQLGSSAIRGILKETPTRIHNGKAFSLTIDVLAGTVTGCKTIAPLDYVVHSQLADFRRGQHVRITNLYLRGDAQLMPTAATVCVDDAKCPTIGIAAV